MNDAKSRLPRMNDLSIAANPVRRIPAFEVQLVQVVTGKIKMRYPRDFRSHQSIPDAKGVLGDVGYQEIGQERFDIGWVDVATLWPTTPTSLFVPIGQQFFEDRRPTLESRKFVRFQ